MVFIVCKTICLHETNCAETRQSVDVIGLKKHLNTDSDVCWQFIIEKTTWKQAVWFGRGDVQVL